MKVTINPIDAQTMPQESQCGVVSWASYRRIIEGMVASGELRLRPGEKIGGIEVGNDGIKFVIEKKE